MRYASVCNPGRGSILVVIFLVLLVPACATYPVVLSDSLKPALSSPTIDFAVDHFSSRIGIDGALEVGVRVSRGLDDYREDFDNEVRTAAALCAALASFDGTFSVHWPELRLKVTNDYGSQLHWKTAHSFTTVTMKREALLELRRRDATASEYAGRWRLLHAAKVGPPDYRYIEWQPAGAE